MSTFNNNHDSLFTEHASRLYRFLKILRESFNTGNYSHRGKFTQRAQAFALHLLRHIQKQIHICLCTIARMNALSKMLHPIRTFTARSTFATRLMLKEMYRLVKNPIKTDSVIQHNHGSRPKVRTERADTDIIHRRIEDFIIHNDQGGGCARRHDRLHRTSFLNPTRMFIDQLTEGCAKG